MRLSLTRAQIKVFSAVCANFVVFWIGVMLATRNGLVLTLSAIFAMVSWDLSVRAEQVLEDHV